MHVDLEELVDFLVKHKMTPNQFFFCVVRLQLNSDLVKRYMAGVGRFKSEELKDLVKRGYLDDVNSPDEEYFDAYFTTPKFSEAYIEKDIAWNEFWEAYPPFMYFSDGKRVPLRGADKDRYEKIYNYKIKNSAKKHKLIMNILEWGKKNNQVNMGIDKFVDSEQWTALMPDYLKSVGNNQTAYGEQEFS